MNPHITIEVVYSDPDLHEIEVTLCDAKSTFTCSMYLGIADSITISEELRAFSRDVHGGQYDLKIGRFGPDYASGALSIHFESHKSGHGKAFLFLNAESDWYEFMGQKVSSQSKMHFICEPSSLDTFISQFRAISHSNSKHARLDGL